MRHRNEPEPGTLIYLVPEKDQIEPILAQTLSILKVGRATIDWLNPDFMNDIDQSSPDTSFRRTFEGGIQLVIQGPRAEIAAQRLVTFTELDVSYQVPEGVKKNDGTTTVIATIVGIVGSTIAIAEQIRKWYQEYRQVWLTDKSHFAE